jgi:hypothetical protein
MAARAQLECRFCRSERDSDAVRCPHCQAMLVEPDPVSGVYELPDGTVWKQVETSQGTTFFQVQTIRGRIDFDGGITGVCLPATVLTRLREKGIGPETVFLTRSSAHRALKDAGWLSTSGNRVGESAFYPEEPKSRDGR